MVIDRESERELIGQDNQLNQEVLNAKHFWGAGQVCRITTNVLQRLLSFIIVTRSKTLLVVNSFEEVISRMVHGFENCPLLISVHGWLRRGVDVMWEFPGSS